MPNPLTMKSWSPYLVGALIGVLSWFTFATAKHPLGITTAFETTAAIAQQQLVPAMTESNSFFTEKSPKIDWGWMVVVGALIGAFVSSRLSGDHTDPVVPTTWQSRFGNSRAVRYAWSIAGGIIMMVGARLAGGCTSGHGISGSLQLAASGWLFVGVVFPAGIATAWLLFGRQGCKDV